MRALVLSVILAACGHPPAHPMPPQATPAGNVHRAIRTTSPEAQRHFDLGLAHAYGFNFDEAQYEFMTALHADPDCAMCMWGIAYCTGANINERDKHWPGGAEAAARAQELAKDPVERGLADALAARYGQPHGTPITDHGPFDLAYAEALRALARAHPDDNDVQILLSEALMLTLPIGAPYWPAGTRIPAVTDARIALESVLARAPDHIGAIHFYIHLMEESSDLGKAIPYADKLAVLAPGAGHLIHMASHLYLRVGRYADAEDANRKAMAADAEIVRRMSPGSTYASFTMHPHHFLWQTLLWQGERAEAREMAQHLVPHFRHMAMTVPKPLGLDMMVAAFTAIRFADWDDALALAIPTTPVGGMAVHYARGLAFVAKKDLDKARAELAAISVEGIADAYKARMSAVAEAARAQLSGAIAYAAGDNDRAIADLQHAAELEDQLDNPLEPPMWIFPARQRLGAIYLALGKAAEAAAVYRADLVSHPENGWTLFGLATALDALHDRGAPAMWKRFQTAWQRSDIKLTSSVL